MSEISTAISDAQRAFIGQQPVFFVGTTGERINLNPEGMNGFRVLGDNLVGYLDVEGPGGKTSARLTADGRITLMFCAFERSPRVLQLHGRGRVLRPEHDEWDFAARAFEIGPDTRQIILVVVESVADGVAGPGVTFEPMNAPVTVAGESAAAVQVDPEWVAAVLNYWLNEVGPQGWFNSSEEEDARCLHLFRALWDAQRDKPAEAFLDDADTALAALVLFDQFPRNMFRGQARAFATDALARDIARAALERGFDDEFVDAARPFFYMPFMHSEDLADHDLSVELFDRPGFENNLKFAVAHRDIIARFGRYPHRNAVLGRETLPAEEEAVAEGSAW